MAWPERGVAIRRGVLYRVPTFVRASGLLVLTNDEWNEATTQDVAGALTYAEAGSGRTSVPGTGTWTGPLLAIPKADLAEANVEFDGLQLRVVEDALCDALALRELLSTPPRSLRGFPGVIDYPRWSQIYYAGGLVGSPPERKRYLAVSQDAYNRALGGAVFVRTTTSTRRGGRGIPTLRDGTTKAVCVLPTFISKHSVAMDPHDRRPQPEQFSPADMAAAAAGLADALQLADALTGTRA